MVMLKSDKVIAMAKCKAEPIGFPAVKERKFEAEFSGQAITSDGGGVPLRAVDTAINLLPRVAKGFTDSRRKAGCAHCVEAMLKQRVCVLALGYKDLNDHDELRSYPALRAAIGRDVDIASASTLCRFENRVGEESLWALSGMLADVSIESFDSPPEEIVLDFDSTADRVHGDQEGRLFHGHYDHYCFLPLYVFCGDHLLAAYLRPINIDKAKHVQAILGLLVKRIRQSRPGARILFRGDSGFCRWKTMRWCDKNRFIRFKRTFDKMKGHGVQ
ncbi:MAG: IS1380 family transposase, partial [Pseudodesulfovibrio sp.]